MSWLERIEIRKLELPLTTPYKLSYRTFRAFEPYIAIVTSNDGDVGFAEGHISPGSSSETREGGWSFVTRQASAVVGSSPSDAKAALEAVSVESPVAATALICAIEMLQGHPLLQLNEPLKLPLLSPVNGTTHAELEEELENRLQQGFRTFKVKVGKDVATDIERLGTIQSLVGDRATFRTDANRAYNVNDAIEFASSIDPNNVELFEQPCAADNWEANAAVAARSRVPIMLDEPICSDADIDRAATIEGVGYCKVKLKRFSGLDRLHAALIRIRERGMSPVLGDGLGAEIACWMEACIARDTIDNAGEFNGYLKPAGRLLTQPVGFSNGALTLPANYAAQIDQEALDAATMEMFTAT